MVRDRTSPTSLTLSNTLEVTNIVFNPAAPQFCYVLQSSNTTKPQLSVISINFPADVTSVAAQSASKPVANILQRYEFSPLHEYFTLAGSDRVDESMEDVVSSVFTGGHLCVNSGGNLLTATITNESGDSKVIIFSLIENSKLETVYK